MIFTDNYSFIYVVLFILLYNVVRLVTQNKHVLNLLLLAGSVVILTTISNVVSISILLAVSGLVFAAGCFLQKTEKHVNAWLGVFIAILIGLFVLKNYKLADLSLLHRVGISYILFRQIHFLIESAKRSIHETSVFSFLNYIIFFPSFIAGPIDDYNNYAYWLKQKHTNYRVVLVQAGVTRLVIGIVKKFFIVPILVGYATDFSQFDPSLSWQLSLTLSLFLYSLYILFDFSGYTDIAIGTAYLIGIKLPENFNYPYFSKNLSDFWRRWHMTFSKFLLTYVFKPLVITLSKWMKSSPRLLVSSIGYILTFVICGIWHGNTMNFIYWGLWHGVGLILFKLWDVYVLKDKKSQLAANLPYGIGAVSITFVFVTFGWFFFNYSTHDVGFVVKNLFQSNTHLKNVRYVNINDRVGFELEYIPSDKQVNSIDIAYQVSGENGEVVYNDVPLNEENKYYIWIPTEKVKMHEFKVRSSPDNSDWEKTIAYNVNRNFEHSYLQDLLFGSALKLDTVQVDLPQFIGVWLPLKDPFNNQEVHAKPEFIKGYGWSVKVNYLKNVDYQVEMEYRFNGGDWKSIYTDRDGKYNYGHLHGNITYQDVNRNLAPGEYTFRMRYKEEERKSKWLETKTRVEAYD